YPLIVVGSGPGGLQVSSALRGFGIDHAILSADAEPGGMFRRWPFFQRLLSWTKPYAPVDRATRAYERYDWNSLIPEADEHRAVVAGLMDGTSYFPSRPEMQAGLEAFATRTALPVRFGCRWLGTRRLDDGRFGLVTSDGEYTARTVVFAVGVAEPWRPTSPGMDLAAHYAQTRPVEEYADKRIFIVGKQNSGFELASGMLPWAKRIIIASPSPAKLSVNTHSLVGIRARYVQPFEDYVLGGGVAILDAAIERIERAGAAAPYRVVTRRSSDSVEMTFEVDEVIAATGFVAPLLDLPDLGVATFGHSRLPAQTPYWESATVPGIFFAGTIGQGAGGLKKHGIPSNSGAVQGARYNARVLARHVAATRFDRALERPELEPADLVEFLATELSDGPELWHQRAYLARVVSLDPAAGVHDEGFVPLASFVDAGGPDALAATLETDGTGAVYPVIYLRRSGAVTEHPIEADPLLDYRTSSARAALTSFLAPVLGRPTAD
ncbi:MAG: NAD(P)-binding domain-containing protein, partial [Candidatus Limnocylindrales bacterium]